MSRLDDPKDNPGFTELDIEGYGGDDPDVPEDAPEGENSQGVSAARAGEQNAGEGSTKDAAAHESGARGKGEAFGKDDATGVGTDLTMEMEGPPDQDS